MGVANPVLSRKREGHIYSKNSVLFLEFMASRAGSTCNLRGPIKYGYPSMLQVVFFKNKTSLKYDKESAELIERCPGTAFVGYALIKEQLKSGEDVRHALALLFNGSKRQMAAFSPSAKPHHVKLALQIIHDTFATSYTVATLPSANDDSSEAVRLKDALEFLTGEESDLSAQQFYSDIYIPTLEQLQSRLGVYVSMWPELKKLKPFTKGKWNRRDWAYMSQIVEEIVTSYSMNQVVCQRQRVEKWELARGIQIHENQPVSIDKTYTISYEGTESSSLRSIIDKCTGRIVVFYVSVFQIGHEAHANSLIIDKESLEIELYEPNGLPDPQMELAIESYLKTELPEFNLASSIRFSPTVGLQRFHVIKRRREDPSFNKGLCVTFNLLYATARAVNVDMDRHDVINKLMTEIEDHDHFIERFVTFTKQFVPYHNKK